jgi:ABC-type phosphate transport system auxiliary subunit
MTEIEQQLSEIHETRVKATENKLEAVILEKVKLEQEIQKLNGQLESMASDKNSLQRRLQEVQTYNSQPQAARSDNVKESDEKPVELSTLVSLFISNVKEYQSKVILLLRLKDDLATRSQSK